MNPDTIVTRFIKKCGSPLKSKLQIPLLVGSELVNCGLTFEPDSVLARMVMKNPATYYEVSPLQILPYLEYQCKDVDDGQNVICSWSTSLITTGYSILDSKPYSRLRVFHTVECMPILIKRDGVGVLIAPEIWALNKNEYTELKGYNRNVPKTEYKIELKWLMQIPGTTMWSVYYTDNHGYGEYILKCSNCGSEIMESDFRKDHPQCQCWCPCDDCEKKRYAKDYIDRMEWYSRRTWS